MAFFKLTRRGTQLAIFCLIVALLSLFVYAISCRPEGLDYLSRSSLRLKANYVEEPGDYHDDVAYNDVSGDATEARDIYAELQVILQCSDLMPKSDIHQEQSFWVLENYVPAERRFKCHESITLTTQGDFTFLDNVEVIVDRWDGPISAALYAPGGDFKRTLDSIAYLRNCLSERVKELVTFHLFFDTTHTPQLANVTILDAYIDYHECTTVPYHVDRGQLYKQRNNLTYPINVARNLARRTATTHFVFPTDIELYPSADFVPKFMQMIADDPRLADAHPPRVFVLPLFELIEGGVVPQSKRALQRTVWANNTFVFHAHLCLKCHKIPKYVEWLAREESSGLGVFTSTKRLGYHSEWEPFFVGTNAEPWFDERLTWEGQSNKMTQGLIMCLLDYDYMVLDNAFLIHKPGIKKEKTQMQKHIKLVANTLKLLRGHIKYELTSIYGFREGCQWFEATAQHKPKPSPKPNEKSSPKPKPKT